MRRAILTGFIFLSILSLPLSARQIDLEAMIEMAERNNKDLQLARLEVRSAGAEKAAAYASALPQVSAIAGLSHEFLEQESIFPGYPINGNQYQAGASLDQILFNLGVLYAIKASRSLNELTRYRYESVRQSILTAVKKSFYQALLLQEIYAVARDSEESARENYENIRDKFESGVASEYELLQAEVNWQNTIPERIKAKRDYEMALNNLKTQTGLPLEEELVLAGSLESYPALPEETVFEQAFHRRPDVKALEWEKKLQEINVRAQRAAYFPNLNASLSYSATAASDKLKWENDTDSFTFGLILSVPVFSGGNTAAQVRKARTEVEKVETRIEQLRDEVKVSLRNINLRLEEAARRIEAARKSVVTAERAYDIALTRVENQLATQVELKEIRVALNQARVNYYSAVFDYLSAYYDWEEAIGNVKN